MKCLLCQKELTNFSSFFSCHSDESSHIFRFYPHLKYYEIYHQDYRIVFYEPLKKISIVKNECSNKWESHLEKIPSSMDELDKLISNIILLQ